MGNAHDAVGLCHNCQHVRRVGNRRGSVFILCAKSATDPDHYARYPQLPVRACAGYAPDDTPPQS